MNPVAKGIAAALGAAAVTPVMAQSAAEEEVGLMEEVTVTGVRRSLLESAQLKRDSDGVVDAIVAEDIGKFPDTNLAESLQRITGVSIDRGSSRGAEGEGQRITVRGIGPDFNLVLLNGRQMPTSSLQATTTNNSRAFDFSNLASESVTAVEVFKTSMATIPTGGIGATVNIRTARPLDIGDMSGSVGLKGVWDDSAADSSVTPEISGIFSNVFADGKFGIALSAIYQERDYGYNQAATTSGWIPQNRLDPGWQALPAPGAPGSENYENLPGPDDLYSLPQNITYLSTQGNRERLNGQLVLQFAPTDSLEFTLDYTYSELTIQEQRNDLGAWFIQCGTCGGSTGSFTDGPIVTPLVWSEDWTGRDVGSGGGIDGWKTELNSLGFNAQWIARDGLGFHFDVHSSTSESGRDNRFGSSSVIGGVLFTSGGRATIDYSQDLPVLSLDLPAGDFAASNMLTGGASFRNSYNKSEVTQADLGGYWDINDTMSLDFGVTSTEVKNRTAFSNVQYDNWGGIGSPDDYPDEVWQMADIRSLFSGIPGANNPALWNQRFVWNFAEVANYRELATGQSMAASDDFTDDLRTTEDSMSLYLQYNWNFDIGNMNSNLRAGIRYEDTDVTSSALVPIPQYITWVAENEYNITFGAPDFTELDGSYDYWLPSLDFSISVMEDLILRASYSQTIGRPDWRSIQGGRTLDTLVRRNFGTAREGNPGLLPLESSNYDLSAEWYYGEGSYVSAAYFFKDTSNYIGVSQTEGTPFNLPHPGNGLWYDECNEATGGGDSQGTIRECIADRYGDSEFVTVTPDGQILIQGVPGQDPAANFLIQTPNNQEDAEIDGFELAWQHMLGETGFGWILNYTQVDSDIAYDNFSTNDQFAVLGLSDSANAVLFYDKNGWIVRLAYNWRDEFLSGTFDGNGIANPVYTDEYAQLDGIISYTFEDLGLTIFAEGFNLTDEYARSFSRREEQVQYVTKLGPRYGIGARWVF